MIVARIRGATAVLGTPKEWDKDRHGNCTSFPVRIADGVCQSAWEPTPEELRMLNAGGFVVLSVVGGRLPPVMLTVEMPESVSD